MNILVFSWRDPLHPLAGGAEQVMHEHMKGWVRAGHSVTLFASRFSGGKGSEKLDGVQILRKSFQYWGVQVAGAAYYLFGKHPKYDLVIDQFHGIPFFTPLYVWTQKLAVIQEVAGKVWLANDLPKPFNWVIGWIGYLGEPLLFWFYKRTPFVTGSASALRDLVQMGIAKKNITIIPHGVILHLPKVLPQKEKVNTVLHFGALSRDKGIEDSIKGFSELSKLGKYQFWVAGRVSEQYKQELINLASRLGIYDQISFHWGFVTESRKFDLMARAHVLVNPSVLEGWGLINIEANAVGTPVVAYNSPGLVDSVQDGKSGVICSTNTPQVMARAVHNLLANKPRYTKMQAGAREWSTNFTWDKSSKQSLDYIEGLTKD